MFPYNLISYGAISICPIIAITLSTESLVSCSVQIEQWMSQGEGRSKKIAKRIAAENMLSMIEETEKMNKSDSSVDEAASPPYFSAVSIYRSGGGGLWRSRLCSFLSKLQSVRDDHFPRN